MKHLAAICISSALVLGLHAGSSIAQITEIIDATGAGGVDTLFHPPAVAADASGNVFVAGFNSNNVFRVTPGGVITEIIDASGAGGGDTLALPNGVATDASGNVFVTGLLSNNVFKITPGGVITEIIDATGDGTVNTLNGPTAIATDASGNVFVAGQLSQNVFKITPGGGVTEIIDNTGDGLGNTLSIAQGVATDASGNVFVAGSVSDNAFKITPGGVITQIIDASGDGTGNTLDRPSAVATDASGNVFITGRDSRNAFKITPGGVITEIIDDTGAGGLNTFGDPEGVATDASGNVFIASAGTENAFKITPGDVITEIIDATGDGLGNTMNRPTAVATDPSGNVFVSAVNTDNAFKIGAFAVMSQSVSADATLDFGGGTASDIDIAGVSGSGDVTVLRRVGTVTDSGSIPDAIVYNDLWVITSDGSLTFTDAEIRFDVDEIPSPSFPDPSAVTIYQRSTPGTGAFSAVATSYDAGTNEIVGTGISSFSEFALGGATALPTSITFDVKIFLEGAYQPSTNNMSTAINAILPLSQPYDSTLFDGTQLDYDGLESVLTMPTNIVDWVLVQLRTGNPASPPMDSVATRAALLKSDGTIVDTSGTGAVRFQGQPDGNYYLVVFHRNHLGVMTPSAVALSSSSAHYDFTTAGSKAFGSDPMKEVEPGVWGLYAAEADVNGLNNANDFNKWLVDTKAVATGYIQTDFDLEGQSTASDFNLWLVNTKAVAVSRVP